METSIKPGDKFYSDIMTRNKIPVELKCTHVNKMSVFSNGYGSIASDLCHKICDAKFIISKEFCGKKQYLESHCSAEIWKSRKSNAKVFNSIKEIISYDKFWRISINSKVEIFS